jgi:Rv0078B-related antitoxin
MKEPQKIKQGLESRQIEVVDDVMAEILRKKTPAERIQIGFKMWTSARKMLTAHLKSIHPEWDDKQISQEVARRLSHGIV